MGPHRRWSIHPYCLSVVALSSLRWRGRIGATVFLALPPNRSDLGAKAGEGALVEQIG